MTDVLLIQNFAAVGSREAHVLGLLGVDVLACSSLRSAIAKAGGSPPRAVICELSQLLGSADYLNDLLAITGSAGWLLTGTPHDPTPELSLLAERLGGALFLPRPFAGADLLHLSRCLVSGEPAEVVDPVPLKAREPKQSGRGALLRLYSSLLEGRKNALVQLRAGPVSSVQYWRDGRPIWVEGPSVTQLIRHGFKDRNILSPKELAMVQAVGGQDLAVRAREILRRAGSRPAVVEAISEAVAADLLAPLGRERCGWTMAPLPPAVSRLPHVSVHPLATASALGASLVPLSLVRNEVREAGQLRRGPSFARIRTWAGLVSVATRLDAFLDRSDPSLSDTEASNADEVLLRALWSLLWAGALESSSQIGTGHESQYLATPGADPIAALVAFIQRLDRNHFEFLEVSKDSTSKEIRAAMRSLRGALGKIPAEPSAQMQNQIDRLSERLQVIGETLLDPEARIRYELRAGLREVEDPARTAAILLQERGEWARALIRFERLCQRAPHDAELLARRALCRFHAEREQSTTLPRVLQVLQQAIALAPTSPFPLRSLMEVYEALGQHEAASSALDVLLAIAPGDSWGLRARVRIDKMRE